MMKKTLIYILIIFSTLSCSKRIVLSNWEGSKYFKVGDSLIVLTKNSIDTLPNCDSGNNLKDSLKNLRFDYIRSIEENYFTSGRIIYYSYDTLTRKERDSIKRTNKTEFKSKWKDYDTIIGNDYNWLVVYKRKHYSEPQKIYYDSLTCLINYFPYTECDGYLKSSYKVLQLMYFPRSTKWRLYRWEVEIYKLKIKGRH